MGAWSLILVLCIGFTSQLTIAEEIYATKVFIITIAPDVFNWTTETGTVNEFSYRASLLNSPDLPSWMHFRYSKHHRTGFLYGVPPPKQQDLQIELIGLNRNYYEARRRVLQITVTENEMPPEYLVELKVDNVNVEDMFDSDRLTRLLDIFRVTLWPESASDLTVTFLASAVQLGARLPLKPNEPEGVVVRLGSRAEFSTALNNLQLEVKPLAKMLSCPRDFKRTTVERYFRHDNFILDWCAFKLEWTRDKGAEGPAKPRLISGADKWYRPSKTEVPQRRYLSEFLLTLAMPIVAMIALALLHSFILCFHHERLEDERQPVKHDCSIFDPVSNEFFDSIFNVCEYYWRNKQQDEGSPDVLMVQYAAVQRATNSLRSLSTQRQLDELSPRLSMERNSGSRPSPPPYIAAKR